ncbi:MAG: GTPase ObgE, partial [Planctomycetes bacterium]|nr:GTPase ObgE [Planctomycetota bacterium]
YVPRGGPAGGDGGRGGSVYLQADESFTTLQHLAGRHHWRAGRGGHGEGNNRHGRNGRDVVVRVPAGTIVYDADLGIVLKDLASPGDRICVAEGGRGGRGNAFFKSPTNQAPRTAEEGMPGRRRRLRLELKLIADAGLVGMPNAGKSTLLSRLSQARPKIADYPFTTLRPYLGIVELAGFRRFVLADLPGLIEGAHAGTGLGDEFLRHVERTRILVHVVDVRPPQGDPAGHYRAIRRELREYSAALAEKPEIIVANKMDLTGADDALGELARSIGREVLPVSAATGRGLGRLCERLWRSLEELRRREGTEK